MAGDECFKAKRAAEQSNMSAEQAFELLLEENWRDAGDASKRCAAMMVLLNEQISVTSKHKMVRKQQNQDVEAESCCFAHKVTNKEDHVTCRLCQSHWPRKAGAGLDDVEAHAQVLDPTSDPAETVLVTRHLMALLKTPSGDHRKKANSWCLSNGAFSGKIWQSDVENPAMVMKKDCSGWALKCQK